MLNRVSVSTPMRSNSGLAQMATFSMVWMRPSDVEVLIGDYSKFHADTGWEPKIPFDQTLEDLLNYWRQRIARK